MDRFSPKRLTLLLCTLYTAWYGLYLWRHGGSLTWSLLVIVGLIVYQWHSSSRNWWTGLIPLVILLLSYMGLGAFSAGLTPSQIHVADLITWERAIFGGIPASYLQRLLFDTAVTPFLDVVTNILYLSHFIFPTVVGVTLWRQNEDAFWQFFLGFFLLSYAGFVTFILFPAAPPWWASRQGYLDDLDRVTLDHFILAGFASKQAPNPVAAIPSLHCAYPFFYVLSPGSLFRRWRRWFLMVCLGVLFSVLYLGHHWLIDACIGYAYAIAATLCVAMVASKSQARVSRKKEKG